MTDSAVEWAKQWVGQDCPSKRIRCFATSIVDDYRPRERPDEVDLLLQRTTTGELFEVTVRLVPGRRGFEVMVVRDSRDESEAAS